MKRLLLIGGGHSQVEVIRQLARNAPCATQVTLASPERHTPYSGMLPGFIAGHYAFNDCHIDLAVLCRAAGVQFQQAQAVRIDPRKGEVLLDDESTLAFDVLSINVGSTPPVDAVPGALEHGIRVKPVSEFLKAWDDMRGVADRTRRAPRIAVIGGGAGGVELALALHHRLAQCCAMPAVHVLTDTATILHGHADGVVHIVQRILEERGITIHARARAACLHRGRLQIADGRQLEADRFIFATGPSAPQWIAASGIQTDERGFVAVNECLQSVSHANVFAAGDVASRVGRPLPKSGVYAVRQGPPLATNLRRALDMRPLVPYAPQRTALALISTGDKYAVASYDGLAFEGAWVWRWKDFIDRRFMRRYRIAP